MFDPDYFKRTPVTKPSLPPLEAFMPYLKDIWDRRWLTNNGHYHQQLEEALCAYLNVPHICLFANATLATITALQALRITGEVVTTPFSFVATTHALWWNNIKPVFADVDPVFGNLDPTKVEAAITPRTTAILPVHVYGHPCNNEALQALAHKYGLKLIYDAAHAFGVQKEGRSILNWGDLSIVSFHATKVFNTFEGGAIICHDPELKSRIDRLKNFGFQDEVTVVEPGINAKMNEFQAALGLLQLQYIDQQLRDRNVVHQRYLEQLQGIPGIRCMPQMDGVSPALGYFYLYVDPPVYGKSRDQLYDFLLQQGIHARRYFYPLISDFPSYRGLPSSDPQYLPIAHQLSSSVLCLPIFPDLDPQEQERITQLINSFPTL